MKYTYRQLILILLIVLIIGGVVCSFYLQKKNKILINEIQNSLDVNNKPTDEAPVTIMPISMCYYQSDATASGYYDKAWLKMDITGDKVAGEFQNLPAEKDSKVGKFEGTVGPLIQKIMARQADVWWDSSAEGMNVKEELVIQFGDGSASAGFGEMVNRGDGVYVYKDKSNLSYPPSMTQIDCGNLTEKNAVEKYIRDNIGTIATDKPVLGGSWYVLSVIVSPTTGTGEVTYEDGHIQSKANFIYTYTNNGEEITVTKFEVVK